MKHSGQTILWELWAALCLCTALVLPPGSPWLHEPALLYPGLSLAVVVPAAWAVWWMAVPPQPLSTPAHRARAVRAAAALRMLRFLMMSSFPFCSYRTVCIPLNMALKGRFPQTKKAFLLAEWQHKKTHDP